MLSIKKKIGRNKVITQIEQMIMGDIGDKKIEMMKK